MSKQLKKGLYFSQVSLLNKTQFFSRQKFISDFF
jgi:hypothetical protein